MKAMTQFKKYLRSTHDELYKDNEKVTTLLTQLNLWTVKLRSIAKEAISTEEYSSWLIASFLSTCTFKILRACNFIRTKAACANVNSFSFAVYNCSYSLDVWFPSSFGTDMGMRNIHTRSSGFTTYFAKVCHLFPPPKCLLLI